MIDETEKVFEENIQKTQFGFSDSGGTGSVTLDNHEICWTHLYNLHTHHVLEISIIKAGVGAYQIGTEYYDIKPFDVFIIGNTEPHRIILENGQTVSNMVIHFEPSFLWNCYGQTEDMSFLDIFFNRNQEFSHRLDRENPTTAQIYSLFLEIECEFVTQNPYHKLRIKILMETILYNILTHYDYCNLPSATAKVLSRKDLYKIDEVMAHINFHFSDHLTLHALAQIACVSPAYFSSIFKRYNGITLFEYITQKRVEHAIQMIRTTNQSLTEIALSCGFNSSTSFNKAFGRITGYAPSFYRKNKEMSQ